MRRFIVGILIYGTLMAFNAYSRQAAAQNPPKERAVVELADKTSISGVIVQKGKYIFEHDYDKKARGEACLYVYTIKDGGPGDLVVSFHCQTVERPKARTTVTTFAMTSDPDVVRLTEIQFAGSTVGHRAPLG
jgi:hypothetical protein